MGHQGVSGGLTHRWIGIFHRANQLGNRIRSQVPEIVSRLKAIKPQVALFPETLDDEWNCGGSHFGKGRTALAQVGHPERRPVGTGPPSLAVSGPPTQPPTERLPEGPVERPHSKPPLPPRECRH